MPEDAVDVDQEEVFIIGGGGERERYHVDPRCQFLERSHRDTRAVPPSHRVLHGLDACRECSGTATRPDHGESLAAKLRNEIDPDQIGGHQA